MSKTYYGLDIHKRFTQVVGVDEKGAVVVPNQRVDNDKESFRRILQDGKGQKVLAMEASYNWYYFMDMLEELRDEEDIEEILLVHPKKTRAIAEAKIKTDSLDARILADLNRMDYLVTSYVPPQGQRDQRERLRHRLWLVRMRTHIKSKVHNVLDKNGIQMEESDIFGAAGRLRMNQLTLRPPYGELLHRYLHYIDELGAEITQIDKEFKKTGKEDTDVMLLKTIPGIGDTLATLLVLEIGDISRFRRSRKLLSYAALIPTLHSSGGKSRFGHIGKEGNRWIRWAMIEAAQACARTDSHRMKRFYNALAKKHGKKVATVALARKMLAVVYHMLKNKEPFRKDEMKRGAAIL